VGREGVLLAGLLSVIFIFDVSFAYKTPFISVSACYS
jgi:hypothetical protein